MLNRIFSFSIVNGFPFSRKSPVCCNQENFSSADATIAYSGWSWLIVSWKVFLLGWRFWVGTISAIFFQKIPLSFEWARLVEFSSGKFHFHLECKNFFYGDIVEKEWTKMFSKVHVYVQLWIPPFQLMAYRNYFCATWKILVQEVFFKWRVKTLSMKERFSGMGILLPVGYPFSGRGTLCCSLPTNYCTIIGGTGKISGGYPQ